MQSISLNKAWATAESTANTTTRSFRKVWLASLGGVSLTRKEISKVVDRLIEEGAGLESSSRKVIGRVGSEAENRISKIQDRFSNTARKATTMLKKQAEVEPMVYHVVPDGEKWAVRREGYDADISVHSVKQTALTAARGIAQAHEPSRLVVHRANGTIQTSHSYGEEQ